MYVREVLHRAPVTVPPSCTIGEAAAIMGGTDVGALLVLDGDQLVGIVTDRDLAVRGLGEGRSPLDRVDAVMTGDVVAVQGGLDLRDVYRIFRDHHVRRLPVLENGDLAGMLTVDDLLLLAVADLGDLVRPVVAEVFFGRG